MSRDDITIRPGREADARALAAMANELNLFEGKPGDIYTGDLVEAQAFGAVPLYSVVVAEAGGELVGYAFFHDGYNSEIAAPCVWLHDLFVREQARSLGVGRRLMAAVARVTVERGATSLCWGVLSSNRRARAFYAGLGAKDEDTRILELDGDPLRALARAGMG
jgi:GNAT superfamily N-acetyltransferase